jgi:predicted Fe-Mo cluster-binding NifX family protein
MRAVVTAENGAVSSRIDPRFGRARWFVIVDTETGEVETHDNQQASGVEHGAGPQAARLLGQLKAQALITGNVGPKAFQALQEAGIEVYLTYAGTVEGTIERLKAGRLSAARQPSNKGHNA